MLSGTSDFSSLSAQNHTPATPSCKVHQRLVWSVSRLPPAWPLTFIPTALHRGARFAVSPGSLPVRLRRRNPSQPAGKTLPREMPLGQQQPVMARMFYQPSSGLHRTLLQTRKRPVPNAVRQRQSSPEVARVVGGYTQPEPYLARPKTVATQHCHLRSQPWQL